nr:formyltransferase family protein [uncultured Draconibacterium sp.]
MPDNIDLGIAAHSFDFIGKRTRYKAKIGWVGYHPSLLPRHRGRSSIEWAIRMGDAITGGTVYWLNSGIDRGDIAAQSWCFIDPALRLKKPSDAASILWRETLCDTGIKLFSKVICDIQAGKIVKKAQDERYATFEPSTELEKIYRPDLLMLNQSN